MILKRVYKAPESGQAPELDYIALGHTGTQPEQHFSVGLVTEMLTKGFMEIDEAANQLIFHTHPVDLVYAIVRRPGRYCLHCGEKLADDQGGELARLHVAQYHNGVASPDPDQPGGYEAINYFDCMLDAEQHARYQKHPDQFAVEFPRKEA